MTPLPWLADTPHALLAQVRDTTLAMPVRDEVPGLVLRGELAPGQRVSEPDVAARLLVSRVPVREVLRELESSGLLAARKHAGVQVRRIDEREFAQRGSAHFAQRSDADTKPDQMRPGPRHQRRQPLHELQRAHDQVRGAIAPWGLELELHLRGGVEPHPFDGQRRPGDAAALLIQPIAVVGIDPRRGVQGEVGHKARKGLVPDERQLAIQAGWLKPSMSAHRNGRGGDSRGIAPRRVNAF